jgi:signal peptidase I
MRRKVKSKIKQYALTAGIALTIGVLLRTFVVQAYRIPSRSMEDTLMEGDFLLVNKLGLRFHEPQAGDVIVFEYPLNPSKDFIKRIVATEGQVVQIVNKKLYVDGESAENDFPAKHSDHQVFPAAYSNRDNFGPFRVPEGQYFVMGDNRDNSQDSREWGFLERRYVKGKALVIYFSWAPDPAAPRWSGVFSFPEILAYNLTHFPWRVRWDRIGRTL